MKLVTYRRADGSEQVGAVLADQGLEERVLALESVAPHGMLALLATGPAGMARVAAFVQACTPATLAACPPLREVDLRAPVPRPGKIVGVGRNYADHAKETGVAPFEKPRIIFKASSSVVGPRAPVPRPPLVTKLDFEAELAVVIGRSAKQISADTALDYVAGYTVLDDVSAREFQFDVAPPQTTFAKSMDGFCPMGPWLVTADEIVDPQTLEVRCWVNEVLMQSGQTADMLFPVATLIAYLSQFMTLEPGDVIATGTPAGSGAFRTPPQWLQPGDRVRMAVSQVGVLEHVIV